MSASVPPTVLDLDLDAEIARLRRRRDESDAFCDANRRLTERSLRLAEREMDDRERASAIAQRLFGRRARLGHWLMAGAVAGTGAVIAATLTTLLLRALSLPA